MVAQPNDVKLKGISSQLSYEPIGYQEHLIEVYKQDIQNGNL